MSNHSPKVFLNTPEMNPVGTVLGTDGLWRLAVTSNGASGSPTSASIDSFGRSRVSLPVSIFDAKQVCDEGPLLFTNHTTGTGSVTYNHGRASSSLEVAGIGRALRQTRRYLNYQPGKSQLIFTTFNFDGAVANVSKRVGYYDDDDGVFVELNSVGGQPVYSICKRSSVPGAAPVAITQSSWNIDPLDGTGPSGLSLDSTKAIILVIDFEWLGVGQVRVGFDFGGQLVYAHRFAHANEVDGVYMRTPNLPVRWEVETSGAGGNAAMESICCSVQSEGGASPLAVQRTASRQAVPVPTVNTTLKAVLSIRLKSAMCRQTVFPLNARAVTTDSGVDFYGQLVRSPTFVSAPTNWVSVPNSVVEYSLDVSDITDSGTVLSEFYGISGAPGQSGAPPLVESSDLNSVLALTADYAGVSDIMSVVVRTLSGTSTNEFYAQLDWLELL